MCLWLENKNISIRDIDQPRIPPQEVLIRSRLAGICRTDLELAKGYYAYRGVPGHEFVGEVVDAPGASRWIGKRVVGGINVACGTCRDCMQGCSNHCAHRSVLGIMNRQGVFAEYFTLPKQALIEVPESLSDEEAVFVEPLAAAVRILDQVSIGSHDKVVVVGAGRLGQLIAEVLKTSGCELLVIAKYPDQRAVLQEKNIAVTKPDSSPVKSADVVIEATGSPVGFSIARSVVRPLGTIVIKSTYQGRLNLDISSLVVDEIKLLGSRCGNIAKALALLTQKKVNVLSLVTERYHLKQGKQAFQHASQPGALKILLRI